MRHYIADVYYGEEHAGTLENSSDSARVIFTYSEDYIAHGRRIAFHLPVRSEPYVTEGLHPFFDSMVSEGWLKRVQTTTRNIDPSNRFLLLVKTGLDLPGKVSIKLRDEYDDL